MPTQHSLPLECRGVWYCCGLSKNTLPGHKYVYCGPMATYCNWHRPMAVFVPEVNKTFFVYGCSGNSPTISLHDHATGQFAHPVVLGSNNDGDAHRNPTLTVADDGTLFVFYGAHNDTTHVLRSDAPYDLSRWTHVSDLPEMESSYPQPWQLKSGELFVSCRHRGVGREGGWCVMTSKDRGVTWQKPVPLIAFEGCNTYAVTIAEEGAYPRKVHVAWSRLNGGTEVEMQTKDAWARRHQLYYACSEDGGATWMRSDGTTYTLPITEEAAEKLYDCGERGVWLQDIQLDAGGNPCILFIDAEVATYESQWKFARHVGGGWTFSDITTSDHMYDDGGLVILADDDFRVYAPTTAVQPLEDGGEIEEWRSADGGQTWSNTQHLTEGSTLSHNNVKVVYGHHKGQGDFRILWSYGDSNYPPETEDVRLFFYGERTGRTPIAFPGQSQDR